MTRAEITLLTVVATAGFGEVWHWTSNMTVAWIFIACAVFIGECADALARRMNEFLSVNRKHAASVGDFLNP